MQLFTNRSGYIFYTVGNDAKFRVLLTVKF